VALGDDRLRPLDQRVYAAALLEALLDAGAFIAEVDLQERRALLRGAAGEREVTSRAHVGLDEAVEADGSKEPTTAERGGADHEQQRALHGRRATVMPARRQCTVVWRAAHRRSLPAGAYGRIAVRSAS
jgi:hypothetical protein